MKKRRFTLIEIMIVIALIGLIGSVVAYNLRGSLDEGKAFKTEQAKAQIHDILWLEVAKGADLNHVCSKWDEIVCRSPLAKDGNKLIVDGWNQKFTVAQEGDRIKIRSDAYDKYKGIN